MPTNAINAPGTDAASLVDREDAGLSGLDSQAFLKLLITQLKNQDPSEPLGNKQLLSQLASMRNLQADIELGEAMKAITTNQQLSTAATFIGKQVSGNSGEAQVRGVVDRAFLRDGEAFVGVGNDELPLKSVASVKLNP